MQRTPIEISTPDIRLDGLLKFAGVAGTGGEAKMLVQSGLVRVNGTREERRGHKLVPGDVVVIVDDENRPQAVLEIRAAP